MARFTLDRNAARAFSNRSAAAMAAIDGARAKLWSMRSLHRELQDRATARSSGRSAGQHAEQEYGLTHALLRLQCARAVAAMVADDQLVYRATRPRRRIVPLTVDSTKQE